MSTIDKAQEYQTLALQVENLIKGIDNRVGGLCNVLAALKEAFPYYFWVGVYIVRESNLVLGPFQGSVASYTIAKGQGVCGSSWAEGRPIIVPDVHQFSGHIACSSLSNSEIVVPVWRGERIIAVLDVDSTEFDSFDENDERGLEQIAKIIEPLL